MATLSFKKVSFAFAFLSGVFLSSSFFSLATWASPHSLGSYQVEFTDEQGFTAVENLWGVGLSLVSDLSESSGLRTNIGVYDMDLNDVHFVPEELKQQTQEYYRGRKNWLKEIGSASWISALPFQTFTNSKNHVDGYKIGFVYELSGVKQVQSSYYLMCDKRMFHLKSLVPYDNQEAQSKKIEKIVSSFRCERDTQKISGLDRDKIQKNWRSVLNNEAKRSELPSLLRDFLVEYELAHQLQNENEASVNPIHLFIKKYFSDNLAWASQNECFFAGWPSSWAPNDQGIVTCSAPKESHGCPQGELKCNPVAFGNVCVEEKFKTSATQICNSEFKRNEQKHSAEISLLLKTDKNALNELASASEKVCESEIYAGSNEGLCKTLLTRVSDIESGGKETVEPTGTFDQIGINPADYDKAYDATQNEAQIFEQYCTEKSTSGQIVMLRETLVNGKHIDCLELKDRLLSNLKALDKLDAKTNFKSISGEACELTPSSVPHPGKAFEKQVKAIACSSEEAKARTKGQCGEDILCSVASTALPPIPGLKVGSCKPGTDSCVTQAVTGIVEALWGTVKGLAQMAGQAVSGLASDTMRGAKNMARGTYNTFFGDTYHVDDASSYKTVQLAKTSSSFLNDFLLHPGESIKKFMKGIWAGINQWMMGDVFCEKWSGVPHLSTCQAPASGWGCLSCKQAINGSCTVIGYVASEIVGSLLTGGAKGLIDGAGVSAKVASLLSKAGELGKLKYTKLGEAFPELAAAAKITGKIEKAGKTATKVFGEVAGGTAKVAGKFLKIPLKFLSGKAANLIGKLEKIPLVSHGIKAVRLTGSAASNFTKAYIQLSKDAFRAGESFGSRVGARATGVSKAQALREMQKVSELAQSVAPKQLGTGQKTLDGESRLQIGAPVGSKINSSARSEWLDALKNDPAKDRAWKDFQAQVREKKLKPKLRQELNDDLFEAHNTGNENMVDSSVKTKNVNEKNRALVKLQDKLQNKYGFTRAEAKAATRKLADEKILGIFDRFSSFKEPAKNTTESFTWAKSRDPLTPAHEAFREAFARSDFAKDNQYISFYRDGIRRSGRVWEKPIGEKPMVIRTPDGFNYTLSHENLSDVRISSTSKGEFSNVANENYHQELLDLKKTFKEPFVSSNHYQFGEPVRFPVGDGKYQKAYVIEDHGTELTVSYTDADGPHYPKLYTALVQDHFVVGDSAKFFMNGSPHEGVIEKLEDGKAYVSYSKAGQNVTQPIELDRLRKPRASASAPKPEASEAKMDSNRINDLHQSVLRDFNPMSKSRFVSPSGYQWAEEVRIPKAGGGSQKAFIIADDGSELTLEWADRNEVHHVKVPTSSVKDHFSAGDKVQFTRNGINQTGKVDKVESGKVFISGENAGQPFKIKMDAELAAKPRVKDSGPQPASSAADEIYDPDPPSAAEIVDQSRKVTKLESELMAQENELKSASAAYAKYPATNPKAEKLRATIEARKSQLEDVKKELEQERNYLKTMSRD